MPVEFLKRLASIRAETERIAAVRRRLSSLKHPRSIEPVQGVRMLDLSFDGAPTNS